eukprot:506981-Pyramimonas_sp.AAC.1
MVQAIIWGSAYMVDCMHAVIHADVAPPGECQDCLRTLRILATNCGGAPCTPTPYVMADGVACLTKRVETWPTRRAARNV